MENPTVLLSYVLAFALYIPITGNLILLYKKSGTT